MRERTESAREVRTIGTRAPSTSPAMADASRGAQSGFRRGNLVHQLVGVQAALHQQFALGFPDQLYAFGCRCLAVWHVDDLASVDDEAMLTGNIGNLGGRTHQDRNDDANFRRLDRAAQ
jgi:hypothetical protein